MSRVAKILFLIVVAIALAQAGWHYAHLPETVATHFDMEGKANGWMPRGNHFALQAGLVILLGALFGNGKRLLQRLPDRFINIPHRDYWLAKERRQATLAALDNMFGALGIVIMGFFMAMFQQIYLANFTGTLTLKMTPLIIGQFVFIVGLICVMMFRFRPPTNQSSHQRRRS